MCMDQIQQVIDDAVHDKRTAEQACQSIDTALMGLRNYLAEHYRNRLHNCLDLKKTVAAVELEQDRAAGLRRHAREEA